MLLPYLSVLNDKNIILGSQSKMRNELMKVQVVFSLFARNSNTTESPHLSQKIWTKTPSTRLPHIT